ncbi:MAG: HAD family phosphatase [Bacteroidota bacterium]
MAIQNLLIDLGDVLYAIDLQKSIDAWQAMVPDGEAVNYAKNDQHGLFSLLDKGQIEIEDFASQLRDHYHLQGEIPEIIRAWEALLIGLIPGRLELILQLKEKGYQLALLSNTNEHHFHCYVDECRDLFNQLDYLFLSFEMGMRKPDAEIYETALQEAGWKASETLFFDDSLSNIEGAKAIGLQTAHIRRREDFITHTEDLLR